MSRPEFREGLLEAVAPYGKLTLRLAVEVVLAIDVDDGETERARAVFRPVTALVASRVGSESDSETLATDVDDSVAVSGARALETAQKTVAVENVVALVPTCERRPVVRKLVQISRRDGRVATETSRRETALHLHSLNLLSSPVSALHCLREIRVGVGLE